MPVCILLGDLIDERRAGADAQHAGIADFDRLSEMKTQTVLGILAFAQAFLHGGGFAHVEGAPVSVPHAKAHDRMAETVGAGR